MLILDKDVQVEPVEQDRYESLVGIVYLGKLNVQPRRSSTLFQFVIALRAKNRRPKALLEVSLEGAGVKRPG